MDNHPIPQDVTGFQFRLIGDMTVKQFAYIAIGGVFAVVFLYAPMPFPLRIPFMILCGGIGVILAFVPLEGRPIDQMISYFLKALVTPNQYAYQKTGGVIPAFGFDLPKPQAQQSLTNLPLQKPKDPAQAYDKEQKLNIYLSTHHAKSQNPLDRKEEDFINSLFASSSPQLQAQAPAPAPVPPVPQPEVQAAPVVTPEPVPQPETPVEPVDSEPETEKEVEQELVKAHAEEDSEKDGKKKAEAHEHVTELEAKLAEIRQQKEDLEKELESLRAQTEAAKESAILPQEVIKAPLQPAPVGVQKELPPEQANVRKISSEVAKDLGLPNVPDVPNLLLGIIKDPRGNTLSNILVEVKDKHGNPARAFRTNQLGQFASATQLPDGTYTIDFEDPKGVHAFDTIEINATGEVIMPIEVISHDEREELRKALFN